VTLVAPILVVDDDPSILRTVSEILAFEEYPVETASNGAEALQVLDRVQPWMVLLDMRMPVMDGWGFIQELQVRGLTLPILVMTAAQDARRWAEEVRAADFLPKPFDLDDLLAAVQRLRDKLVS
jgi:two-component system chemotaxis response regulator CheY